VEASEQPDMGFCDMGRGAGDVRVQSDGGGPHIVRQPVVRLLQPDEVNFVRLRRQQRQSWT